MADLIQQAFEFKHWADQRTLESSKAVAQTDALAFIRQQLNHLLIVQDLFRARLVDEPEIHGATNTETVPEFELLEQGLLESNRWYLEFVQSRDTALDLKLKKFWFTDGQQGAMSQLEMLFHIVNHGSYHRGSIARALDLADVPHPADIFTMYLHDSEPSRRR